MKLVAILDAIDRRFGRRRSYEQIAGVSLDGKIVMIIGYADFNSDTVKQLAVVELTIDLVVTSEPTIRLDRIYTSSTMMPDPVYSRAFNSAVNSVLVAHHCSIFEGRIGMDVEITDGLMHQIRRCIESMMVIIKEYLTSFSCLHASTAIGITAKMRALDYNLERYCDLLYALFQINSLSKRESL